MRLRLLLAALAAVVAITIVPAAAAVSAAAPGTNSGRRLVIFDTEPAVWMTEEEIEDRVHNSPVPWVNFQDVTDHPQFADADFRASALRQQAATGRAPSALPTVPTQQARVTPLLGRVSEDNLRAWLLHLESYWTRARNTDDGNAAAHWIGRQFQLMADSAGRSDVQVTVFEHTNWRQPSVIVRVPGSLPADQDEAVIIGAHLDSISGNGAPTNRAPGADDDASGLVAAMESFRVLVQSGFRPKRTLIFAAFAAEENGLLGSTDLVARYFQGGRTPVYSMMQSEMNGWLSDRTVTVINDANVHRPLTQFAGKLVSEYTNYGVVYASTCGACSDHVPFHRAGYRVTCVAEAGPTGAISPHYHKSTDLTEHLSVPQVAVFAKVMVAYAIELSLF